jgi:hypothetical protein
MLNPEQIVAAGAKLTLKQLSDEEIVILHNFLTFPGSNIEDCQFYCKIKSLFTEHDGTKMHPVTSNAVMH